MSFGLSYLASSLLSRGPKGEHTIDAHGHWKPDIHKESLFVKGDVN